MHRKMTFVDGVYKESIIRDTIAIMIDLDACNKTESLKKIIFGFNHNDNTYGNRYYTRAHDIHNKNKNSSMFIANKITSHMTKIRTADNNIPSSNSRKMSFYKDDTYKKVRIYTNEYVIHILDVLSIISIDIVDFKYIVDMIVYEWIDSIAKDTFINTNSGIISCTADNICLSGKYQYHWLPIMEKLWEKMKYISRTKGLKISDAFTYAVITFIDSRHKIAKHTGELGIIT